MNVSNVSSGMSAFMTYWQSTLKQSRQDFSQLGAALQSGDLTAAQSAFADLTSITPGLGNSAQAAAAPPPPPPNDKTPASSSTRPDDPRAVVQSDIADLGTALKSGDLSAAQKAFTKLQADMQAMRKGRRHHGHHGHDGAGGTGAATSTTAPSAARPISTTPPANTASASKKDTDGDNDGSTTFYGIDVKG